VFKIKDTKNYDMVPFVSDIYNVFAYVMYKVNK